MGLFSKPRPATWDGKTLYTGDRAWLVKDGAMGFGVGGAAGRGAAGPVAGTTLIPLRRKERVIVAEAITGARMVDKQRVMIGASVRRVSEMVEVSVRAGRKGQKVQRVRFFGPASLAAEIHAAVTALPSLHPIR